MREQKRRVLFLCTGNSCRSQMAEAIVNARLGGQWQAVSAGTQEEVMAAFRAVRDAILQKIPALLEGF